MISLEQKAKEFASNAHGQINQRRKYTDEPYIVHPSNVVKLIKSIPHDEEMICAGWLHDVVEDTSNIIEEIYNEFGHGTALLVSELTDISRLEDGNRSVRKQIDLEHTRLASPRAKTIKLADLIDNSSSILKHDPRFAKVYMKEKIALLDVLKEGNQTLFKKAQNIVDDYIQQNIKEFQPKGK